MTAQADTIQSRKPLLAERTHSAFLGCAIGESMGLEANMDILRSDCTNGCWGESTSLILATADSIAEVGRIDYSNIMEKFLQYLQEMKYTSSGMLLNTSIISKCSILRYQNGESPLFCGACGENANGNSALARILPASIYTYAQEMPFPDRIMEIDNFAFLTHGHEISQLGCNILTDYICFLLSGLSKTDAIQKLQELPYDRYFTDESLAKYKHILTGEILTLPKERLASTEHIVHTLERCLWTILHTDNFIDAVLTSIHFGGSPGRACAVTGALCGILYGKSAIPTDRINNLANKSLLDQLANNFINILIKENNT